MTCLFGVDVTKTGVGNEDWGMGNGEWGTVVSGNTKNISWSLRSTAKRRGLHVVSERWKVRIFICQFFPGFWNYNVKDREVIVIDRLVQKDPCHFEYSRFEC